MQICTVCKKWKEDSEFNYSAANKNRNHCNYHCKECRHEYQKKYRQKNRERLRIQQREYRINNPLRERQYTRNNLWHKRQEILFYYSNGCMKCELCNEEDLDVLTIDHINGGGKRHRCNLRLDGTELYRWLLKNNFPEGYRVLCRNCNWKEHVKKLDLVL